MKQVKATINQVTNDEIYHGEDKVFTFYFYNSSTFEAIDLSGYTGGVTVCLKNTDNTDASFVGTLGTSGKFEITIPNAEAELLSVGNQYPQVNLVDASANINIEILANYITIKEKNC